MMAVTAVAGTRHGAPAAVIVLVAASAAEVAAAVAVMSLFVPRVGAATGPATVA